MSSYLLDGPEFNTKILDYSSTLTYVTFEYLNNIASDILSWNAIDVSANKNNSIIAYINQEGTTLVIACDDDIFASRCNNMFVNMSNLQDVKFNNFNISECTSLRRMFMNCENLLRMTLGSNCISNTITDFTEMMSGCFKLTRVDITNIDVPKSSISYNMFYNCSNLRILKVGNTFTVSDSMNLSNPNSDSIPGTNGKWNNLDTAKSYTANSLPVNCKASYYAIDVTSEEYDNSFVTVGMLKKTIQELSRKVGSKLEMLR